MTLVHAPRRGMALMEVVIALAVLTAVMVGVAQMAVWASTERTRLDARAAALEIAANQMEQARATPWDDLTVAWATAAKVPETYAARWPDARLAVTIAEPEPRLKQVTVTVRWEGDTRRMLPPVVLTSQFAARTGEGK